MRARLWCGAAMVLLAAVTPVAAQKRVANTQAKFAPLPDLRIISATSVRPYTWVSYEVANEGKADVTEDMSVFVSSALSKTENQQSLPRLKAGEKRGFAIELRVDKDKYKPDGFYEGTVVTLRVVTKADEVSKDNNTFAFVLEHRTPSAAAQGAVGAAKVFDPNAPRPDLRILSAKCEKPYTWVSYEVANEGKADVAEDMSVFVSSALSKTENQQSLPRLKVGEKRGFTIELRVDTDKYKPGSPYEGTVVTLRVVTKAAEISKDNNTYTLTLGAQPAQFQRRQP